MEERLKFLASGAKPRKNKEVMGEVIEELKKEGLYFGDKVRVAKEDGDHGAAPAKKTKKDKKDKKRKHSEVEQDEEAEAIEEQAAKKKKKKSKD